ncbi:MAG TPA: DNA polymerase I [Bryobacteraceae bacterium]|nr:DNA polymerase I [Bryobacteraceae bacterium]
MSRPRLFLIDAFGFIFRAYHARARSGAPPMRTRSGLSTEAVYIFHNMLRKLISAHHPDYIAAIFESGPSFREQEFADYKANRAETPPDLLEQIPYVRRLLETMRIPVLEHAGFEADDVIGAIAHQAKAAGVDVVIVSSDKDMMQLVDDRVSMLNPTKDDTLYDPAKVEEFMGVAPSQVADLLALKGDAVDNIPGAPGIGEKGAKDLIARFGSVENLLERASEVERKMYRESLLNHRDQVLLSKRLATIDTTVPVEWDLGTFQARPPDDSALREIYKDLEFFSLLKEVGGGDSEPRDYRAIETGEELAEYLAAIPPEKPVAVAVQAAGEGELSLSSLGLAGKCGEGRAVPFSLLEGVRGVLEDEHRPKVAHDAKTVLIELARNGIEARGFTEDVMLYAFLLEADPSGCSLEQLAQRRFDRKLGGSPEERADCALELAGVLGAEVDAQCLRNVYDTIDMPLVSVLTRMERTGIRIDPSALGELSNRMDSEIQRLTAEIHSLAGRPFNINSPQQLGKVLFEDLSLAVPVRYGKGKAPSTAADVLEELAAEHLIAAKVLEYRQLAKLKGTYVDALPALIRPDTGRLHTSFNQVGAATGRLSSSNPNLQNIPIRTELGREIRAAFVPREGWLLVAADYSQIELRLLAHMSRDPVLVEAFRNGEDIHTRTAAEVFGVPPLMVTPDLRRNAKAVNFGIVYGLSAFGLSGQLGIPQSEAQSYIKSYFERYAGVRKFIDDTIAEVRKNGVTRTLFGRRRPIPDIASRNPNARGFAERTAVNTPLQGTAADLIKLAMIRIDRELRSRGLQTAMLLQVHDELLFETPPSEIDEVSKLVKHEMESVHRLEVPLVVDIGAGSNWRDAK